MLKKIIIATVLVMFTMGSSITFASEGPNGNKRKGKYTYRKVVKRCFKRGNVDSATPKISPADKSQAEWKAIFEGKNFSEFGCSQEWAGLSNTDTLDIYSYFYNFASDSDNPASCK
ncbi:MAG: cytochrome c family protein [Desulfobacteraceae bacterium]|nr:cytochrome c family protein [Desulfobacteraceae bacterium]